MTRIHLGTLLALVFSGGLALGAPLPERYILHGMLAGEPVQLELTLNPSGRAEGQFIGKSERLEGSVAKNGSVRLGGAALELTGKLPQPFEEGKQVFSGKLAAGAAFRLAIAASYLEQHTVQGPFLEVSSETPIFSSPPWQQVNEALERFVQTPATSFLREGRAVSASGELNYGYTYENRLEVRHFSPTVLSLLETQFFYTGGAHPNTTYRSLNFYNDNGTTERLTLKDIFLENSGYRNALLSEVTRRLKNQRASWIVDGSLTLTPRDLSVFTLNERGLEFAFSPYAVGPYAEGAFFVMVPYEKLATLLRPSFLP